MQILLANAKIMFDTADRKPISVPLFQSVANVLAEEMARDRKSTRLNSSHL